MLHIMDANATGAPIPLRRVKPRRIRRYFWCDRTWSWQEGFPWACDIYDCHLCGQQLRLNACRSYGGWVHQDGSVYKTFIDADGEQRDDHCVLPRSDREAAQRMAAKRVKEGMK